MLAGAGRNVPRMTPDATQNRGALCQRQCEHDRNESCSEHKDARYHMRQDAHQTKSPSERRANGPSLPLSARVRPVVVEFRDEVLTIPHRCSSRPSRGAGAISGFTLDHQSSSKGRAIARPRRNECACSMCRGLRFSAAGSSIRAHSQPCGRAVVLRHPAGRSRTTLLIRSRRGLQPPSRLRPRTARVDLFAAAAQASSRMVLARARGSRKSRRSQRPRSFH